MKRRAKSLMALTAIVFLELAIVSQGVAQTGRRGYDPWGWSGQTNEDGIRVACETSISAYNTTVALYNAASNSEKKYWLPELERLQAEIDRWCNR